MLRKFLTFTTAMFLAISGMSQSSPGSKLPEAKVELKSAGLHRNFYAVDLQQLDENQCGSALQAFYNAQTFTVTSTLLAGNRVEISGAKSMNQSVIEKEIREIMAKIMDSPERPSGDQQMMKFKQKK